MEVKQEEFELVERELLRENHDITTICKRTGLPEEKVVELVDIVEREWKDGYKINTIKDRNILLKKTRDTEHRLHELREQIIDLQILTDKEFDEKSNIQTSFASMKYVDMLKVLLQIEQLITQTHEKQIALTGVAEDNKLMFNQGVMENWAILSPIIKKLIKEGGTRYTIADAEKILLSADTPSEDSPEYRDFLKEQLTNGS